MNTSPRPKSVALVFLLGAFVTGGAVGYAATKTFDPPTRTVTMTPLQMRMEIKQNLHLTQDQQRIFDEHYDARRLVLDSLRPLYEHPIDSIRAIYEPRIDSIRTDNQQRFMKHLDPTQKAKYTQMIEDDKMRADSTQKALAK